MGPDPDRLGWALLNSSQQDRIGWVGWVIGLVGLIGTNLIRVVAEKFEHLPITTPVRTGTGNVDLEDI